MKWLDSKRLFISSTWTLVACAVGCGGSSASGARKVETPDFDVAPADYNSSQTVGIHTATEGAAIYFTLDGSIPSRQSARYTVPITIAKTTMLEAIAVEDGFDDSDVRAGTYTITIPPGAVGAVQFEPAAGEYTNDVLVTLSSGTAGATICYTSDGTQPACDAAAKCTRGSEVVAATPLNVTKNDTSIRAVACRGGMSAAPETHADYLLSAAKPSFDPSPGGVDPSKPVTVSTITKGAVIHYTVDKSTPDCSSGQTFAGSGTFSVFDDDTTIRAIACKNGYADSEVVTLAYPGALCRGDFHVASTADLGKLAHCREITGSLFVQGDDIVDLSPLRHLAKVDGDLILDSNPQLTSMSGLDSLTSVGQRLDISGNRALAVLDGFPSLETVGTDLLVIKNDALQKIDAFPSLRTAGSSVPWPYANFTVKDNVALSVLHGPGALTEVGNLSIFGDALTSVTGFPSLTKVRDLAVSGRALTELDLSHVESAASLYLKDLPSLRSLAGLRSLATLGDLTILDNLGFTDLHGLEALTTMSGMLEIENSGLVTLDGLNNLTTVWIVWVDRNSALRDLSALDGLETVTGYIVIQENSALAAIGSFNALTELSGTIAISGNNALTHLNGLHSLKQAGDVWLFNNPAMTKLDGLDALVEIGKNISSFGGLTIVNDGLLSLDELHGLVSVGGQVRIDSCSALSSLAGLDALKSVDGELMIVKDPALANIGALAQLSNLGGNLVVESNTTLPTCQATDLAKRLQSNPDYKGTVTIDNNGTGTCN